MLSEVGECGIYRQSGACLSRPSCISRAPSVLGMMADVTRMSVVGVVLWLTSRHGSADESEGSTRLGVLPHQLRDPASIACMVGL